MLTIRNTVNNKIIISDIIQKGSWINLISPTEAEITEVTGKTGIYYEFLKSALDDEERPRVEIDNEQILIIINVPIIKKDTSIYDTVPLGIVLTNDNFVTICLEELILLNEFYTGQLKGMATYKKTRFLYLLLYKVAQSYLKYLREINKKTEEVEFELHKSMKNKELIKLLNLQKSLVYFSTSLRSNQIVMEKLLKTSGIERFEEDEELLEDVIIENQQAIDMANIYTNILSGTMNAFASIISNNLNIVMKFLAAVTIVLAIPTMIASFFGMNVAIPFQDSAHGFLSIVLISVGVTVFTTFVLAKNKMF